MTDTSEWSWVRHWTDLLNQKEVWRDATNTILRLDDMDPGYCGRVRAFILRQAEDVYLLIGSQLAAAPNDMSESATVAFDQGFDQFLDTDPRAWLEGQPLLIALAHRKEGRPARSTQPLPPRTALAQEEHDPFGPYEYVEPSERCVGAEGRCTWGECGQRTQTCPCRCAWCRKQRGSVAPQVELREHCAGYQHHEDVEDWSRCTGRRSTCRCMCAACCGDTPDVWGAPSY